MSPTPRSRERSANRRRTHANYLREVKSKAATVFEGGNMPEGISPRMREQIGIEVSRMRARSSQERRVANRTRRSRNRQS